MRNQPESTLVLAALLCCLGWGDAVAAQSPPCPATPLQDRLPEVIAPMAGADPIWLVDGSFGRWKSPDTLNKSAWVVARGRGQGPLRVRGRRIDGPGTMLFQVGLDGMPTEVGVLEITGSDSVQPAGAGGAYIFGMMYLIFPSPGCWELTAAFAGETRTIVVQQAGAATRR